MSQKRHRSKRHYNDADEDVEEAAAKHQNFLFDDLISGRVDTFVKSSVKEMAKQQQQKSTKELLTTVIDDLEDVDFVLIAHKPHAKPFLFRIGVRLASRGDENEAERHRNDVKPITAGDIYQFRADLLRQAYLDKLNSEYSVAFKRFETEDHVFYAINLSFAHLGLMAQLLAYHWRLSITPKQSVVASSTTLPPIDAGGENISTIQRTMNLITTSTKTAAAAVASTAGVRAYKAFYFIKKLRTQQQPEDENSAVDYRYKEYHDCTNRASYSSQLRHDLAYNFLVGARVKLEVPRSGGLSPWPDVFSCGGGLPASKKRPLTKTVEVNLNDVIEHSIFDDWLCLHQPIPETPDPPSDVEGGGCCGSCCYPCITCRCCCKPASKNLNGSGFCASICTMWRNIWYTNTVDCVDIDQRPNESDRQFLSRVCTLRNALNPSRFFKSDDDGDGSLDTDKELAEAGSATSSLYRMYHLLPLETLRRYFGEKIGFYFCWAELIIMTLIVPGAIGLAMFIAGLIYYSVQVDRALISETQDEAVTGGLDNITTTTKPNIDGDKDDRETPGYVLAKACDNYATIGFAAVMIIWGTAFGELWKRRNCWYRFLWKVGHLEDSELRRVNVYNLRCIEYMHAHSTFTHYVMYLPSLIVTFLFILLVWASIYLINMLDVRLSMEHCNFPPPPEYADLMTTTTTTTTTSPNSTEANNLSTFAKAMVAKATSYFLCNIICVVLHSVSIALLDAIFTRICYSLTHLEGHATQSSYNASLILKMFTFRFINNYSVLFYIAFVIAPDYGTVVFPEVLSGVNETNPFEIAQARYRSCKQLPCMTLLSKQLLGIILTAPLIRTFKDRLLPSILALVKHLLELLKKRMSKSKIGAVSQTNVKVTTPADEVKTTEKERKLVAELKLQYEELQELSTLSYREFTIEEFTEKAIVFGALLMFSVALPPAPVLAMLIMRIDLNFDITRMVETFRRPVPTKSSGIGVWAEIIEFLTFCGIVTNPLIVVLTSSWSKELTLWWKFWVFLIFEHVVFLLRTLVAACVPDEPRQLRNLRLRQKMAKSIAST